MHFYTQRHYTHIIEKTFGNWVPETVLYVPQHAVLAYRNKDSIHSFRDDVGAFAEAEENISGTKLEINYLGERDVAESLVESIVQAGKAFNASRRILSASVEALSDLL